MHGLSGAVLAGLALLLAGCGRAVVKPDLAMPKALVEPLSARTGLLLDETLRNYVHEETRGGGSWRVELGAGHEKLFRSIFESSFAPVQVFTDAESARAATGLQAVFRPQIEQYSFATSAETGRYWAVTISYRIGVLAPGGDTIDTLTLTGYGSSQGMVGRERSLAAATQAAMRDAAAKFLVQIPRQIVAQKLRAGEVLQSAEGLAVVVDYVEAVPIDPPSGGDDATP